MSIQLVLYRRFAFMHREDEEGVCDPVSCFALAA